MRIHKITWRETTARQHTCVIHLDLDRVIAITEPHIKTETEGQHYILGCEFTIRLDCQTEPIIIKTVDSDRRTIHEILVDDMLIIPDCQSAILSQFIQVYEAWTGTVYGN